MSSKSYQHVHKTPEDGAPLVFTFHGTGGDEHQFTGLIEQILPQAGIVSPRGDVSEHGANRFFRRRAEGLYDMEDLGVRREAMAKFIAAHAEAHKDAATYGLGYSNGANILASVQFAAPELFDTAILMHPLIPFTPPKADFTGKRVLITAGQRDPMASAATTQALHDYFAANGAEASLFWHPGGHELRQEELLEAQRLLLS